jgi:hypothetical protein
MVKIVKAAEGMNNKKSGFIQFLVMGQTGSGKSHLIATAKNPLILLTEANGFASIAASNPNANICPCYNLKDFDEALRAIKDGKIKDFDTLIIDSLTEFQRMIKERILTQTKKSYLSQNDWGTLASDMIKYIRAIIRLPCDFVATTLIDDRVEETSGIRYVKPMFEGQKTAAQICTFFTAVGLVYKEEKENQITRALLLDGPDRISIKPFPKLTGKINDPNLSKIFAQVRK